MKLFKFIRNSLSRIGFKASYIPKHDSVGIAPEATVKESEDKIVRQRVREVFAAQEKEMTLRAAKAHAPSCEDNWTCRKNPCLILEPDVIVRHAKRCVHVNGIIMSEPICKCGKRRDRVIDKDFER